MIILAKIGKRLYEFNSAESLRVARSLYVRGDCRSQRDLEEMIGEAGIDYFIFWVK